MGLTLPKWARRQSTKGVAAITAAIVVVAVVLGGGTYALFFAGNSQPATTNSVNLQKGLVGYWKFDDNFKDSTPYATSCTNLYGGSGFTADRKGAANSALDSGGLALSCGKPASLRVATVSVSAWVNPTSWNSGGAGVAGDGGYNLFFGDDGTIHADLADSGQVTHDFSSPSAYALGQWYFVAFTYDGSTVKIYVNGSEVTSESYTGGIGSSLYDMYGLVIGTYGQNSSTRTFHGSIDDLRVYNRAINASEAKALYDGQGTGLRTGNLQKGLVGHWKLDGNLKDSTPYGDNCDWTYQTTGFAADRKGQADRALSTADNFSGYDAVKCADTDESLATGSNVSVSAWVYNTSFQTGSQYAGNGIFGYGSYQFYFDQNKHLAALLDVNGGGNQTFASSQTFSTNQWYHVTMTYDGSTVRLYANGSQVYSVGFTDYKPGSPGDDNAYIGSWQSLSSGRILKGYIDDVRVYNRALSADEITQLNNSYDSQINLGGSAASGVNLAKGLISSWQFNGNVKDSTPYSNNGTIQGAVTSTTGRDGSANGAYSFDGDTGYISTANNINNPQQFSISTWFKTTSSTGGVMVGFGSPASGFPNGGYENELYINDNGQVKFATNYLNLIVASPGSYNDGTWHLVTMTQNYNTGSLILYVDGQQVDSTTLATNYQSMTGYWRVGELKLSGGSSQNDTSSSYYSGAIDNMRVYNRILSAAEVQALYNLND